MTPFANLSKTGGPAPTANDSIDDFIDQEGCSIAVLKYWGADKYPSFAASAADPQSISILHPAAPCSGHCMFTKLSHICHTVLIIVELVKCQSEYEYEN